MKPVVRFDHVSKQYRLGLTRTSLPALLASRVRSWMSPTVRAPKSSSLWALRDITFELHPGDAMALVGPNGAGKSTLLKLLSNITAPTEGTIEVNGRMSALLELGAGFHPDLTGRENIFLNGTILGLSRQDVARRFDEIVAFSEIEDFIDTPVKRYSSGMAVRLGFSVAACIQPEILLVDEVLAVGDAPFREKCLARIRQMIERGTTVIFVSHNLYMVQVVCNRAIYLRKGQVRSAGEAAGVIEAYERDLHADRAQRFETAAVSSGPPVEDDPTLDLTSVVVEGPRGASDEELDAAEPMWITIHYHAYAEVGPVNLAVFLLRSDGVTCAMIRSKIDGFGFHPQPGQGRVSVELRPLQLVTGTYFAEVELTNASDSMVLKSAPTRSAWFSVRGRTRSYDARSGVFEPDSSWRHLPGDAPELSRAGSHWSPGTPPEAATAGGPRG